MILAGMINAGEEELICDLAETYHILDMRALPPKTVATLAVGLRENSRIKMKIAGMDHQPGFMMQSAILDGIRMLIWMQTKDGTKGRNRPKSMVEQMIKKDKKEEVLSFNTPEEFERAWNNGN